MADLEDTQTCQETVGGRFHGACILRLDKNQMSLPKAHGIVDSISARGAQPFIIRRPLCQQS
jgi:hypothetical protein